MAIDLAPELLDILACPNCHGSLAVDHDRDELVCLAADCGLAYPVRQGIPVLLIDEARRPGPDLPLGSASSAASASPPESTTSTQSAAGTSAASGSTAGRTVPPASCLGTSAAERLERLGTGHRRPARRPRTATSVPERCSTTPGWKTSRRCAVPTSVCAGSPRRARGCGVRSARPRSPCCRSVQLDRPAGGDRGRQRGPVHPGDAGAGLPGPVRRLARVRSARLGRRPRSRGGDGQ